MKPPDGDAVYGKTVRSLELLWNKNVCKRTKSQLAVGIEPHDVAIPSCYEDGGVGPDRDRGHWCSVWSNNWLRGERLP